MDKLFRQVPIDDKHAGTFGMYFTSTGEIKFGIVYLEQSTCLWLCTFFDDQTYVTHTLEEVELPTEDEILEYARDEQGFEDYDTEQDVFVDGANYILNTLKGGKNEN